MGREDELVPEAAEEKTRGAEPGVFQEVDEEAEEERVPAYFNGVGGVIAIVQTGCTDALVELAVFLSDVFLVLRVQRGVIGCV